MRKLLRTTLLAGLAAVVLGGPLAAAAPALAAPPAPPAQPVCKTAVTKLYDRPDSGNHGDWALDGTKATPMTRTVRICEQAPVVLRADAVAVKPRSLYTATVADQGVFTTVAGHSPNAGKALPAGITGWLSGSHDNHVAFTASFTAEAGFANYQATTYDGDTYHGTAPSSTGDWIKNLWGGKDFEQVTNLVGWSWTYWTCSTDPAKAMEKWVDAEDNKAGSIPTAGDITGKPCPTPSASASASAGTGGSAGGGVVASSSSSAAASLPVTGSQATAVAGLGGLVLALGVLLVMAARRRRTRTEFTAD
jgi:LPXTG-motif cell wall-anchored protein